MNKNNKKLFALSIAMMAITAASPVIAALYVSPVVRNSVEIDKVATPSEINAAEELVNAGLAEHSAKSVSGNSKVHGPFVMKDRPESVSTLMRYGRNVPLFVALEKVIPDSDSWFIHMDDGLEGSVVNWDGGGTWEEVLGIIEQENGLHIVVNNEEKAIGVSFNGKMAISLANQIPQVWRLETNKSLRQNLDAWASRAGWSLQWDSALNFDYPIDHSAVLTGGFAGEGGVVDQVLYSLRNNSKPLTAVFYEANNVVLVTSAGFKQEVVY